MTDELLNFGKLMESNAISLYKMCNADDRNYLRAPKETHTIEGNVRIICISTAIDLTCIYFFFTNEAHQMNNYDELNNYMESIKYDYDLITGWINSFIEEIKDPTTKEQAKNIWIKKQKRFTKETFSLDKIL